MFFYQDTYPYYGDFNYMDPDMDPEGAMMGPEHPENGDHVSQKAHYLDENGNEVDIGLATGRGGMVRTATRLI